MVNVGWEKTTKKKRAKYILNAKGGDGTEA